MPARLNECSIIEIRLSGNTGKMIVRVVLIILITGDKANEIFRCEPSEKINVRIKAWFILIVKSVLPVFTPSQHFARSSHGADNRL